MKSISKWNLNLNIYERVVCATLKAEFALFRAILWRLFHPIYEKQILFSAVWVKNQASRARSVWFPSITNANRAVHRGERANGIVISPNGHNSTSNSSNLSSRAAGSMQAVSNFKSRPCVPNKLCNRKKSWASSHILHCYSIRRLNAFPPL